MNLAKTASVKSVTTDTKILDAKRVETAELLVDGVSISEVVPKWKPREHIYRCVLEEDDDYIIYDDEGNFLDCKLDTLENGTDLFSGTKGMEEFSFSLPSLTTGSNMFANCNLGEKAVESILRTIPEYSEGSHPLTMNISADTFEKFNEITGNYLMAPGTISYKGWEIASNAVITIPVEELTAAIEEIVGEGKVIVDTVPTENKVVVHTDRVDDTQLEAVTALLESGLPQNVGAERYNHHIEVSWRDINKYAECVDAQAVYEANPEVNQWTGTSKEGGRGYQFFDVCSDGSIPFSFDSLKNIYSLSGGYGHNMFDYLVMQRGVKKLHLKLPIIIEWLGINGLEEINLDAPNLIRFYENYSSSLKRIKVNSLKIINLNNAAWRSPIESIEGEFPVLESGKISSENGILDKASVLRICNTVPTWATGTHELWLGIHLDHQYDSDVNLALKRADINYEPTVELPEVVTEGKGWTLKVQWNGTPTAQAAGTFATGSLIYAKVSELENGERYLDWGHYVTNWEERGYETFRSVEAAREYYGLPVEDVEEEEVTNV